MRDRENEIISLVTFIHNKTGFRGPPFSLQEFCENFPDYELRPADLPQGFNGEILTKGRHRIVRYRSASSTSTNRFTIAHEIGHGFLHENLEFKCSVSSNFSIFSVPEDDPREWEADYFSAEILMPMPVLNRIAGDLDNKNEDELGLEIIKLSEMFGVTKHVMKSRLKDLAKMRDWEGDYL